MGRMRLDYKQKRIGTEHIRIGSKCGDIDWGGGKEEGRSKRSDWDGISGENENDESTSVGLWSAA